MNNINSATMKIDDQASLNLNGDSIVDNSNNIDNKHKITSPKNFNCSDILKNQHDSNSNEIIENSKFHNINLCSNSSDSPNKAASPETKSDQLGVNITSERIIHENKSFQNVYTSDQMSKTITNNDVSSLKHTNHQNGHIKTNGVTDHSENLPFIANGSVTKKHLNTPFPLLPGEEVCYQENKGDGIIYLTNYRLFTKTSDEYLEEKTTVNLPIASIDYLEMRDMNILIVFTKYVQSFTIQFKNSQLANDWSNKITQVIDQENQKEVENTIKKSFCFTFAEHVKTINDYRFEKLNSFNEEEMKLLNNSYESVSKEFKRMQFDSKSWKIFDYNKDFKLCPTYPKHFILPAAMEDEDLVNVAKFRYSQRIPVVSWRSQHNGCVIARSAQPLTGFFWGRSSHDEKLFKQILCICKRDTQKLQLMNSVEDNIDFASSTLRENLSDSPDCNNSEQKQMSESNGCVNNLLNNRSLENLSELPKLLILDARSFSAALGNKIVGGGYEFDEYYNSELQNVGIVNIHKVRTSFQYLRSLCEASQIDNINWFTLLDNTKWFITLSSLLKASMLIVDAISIEARPVLVHCSDGWDRTPQMVSLAELMLDPYYRTIEGFKVMIEREWLQYGHKFLDRGRSSLINYDHNEKCPIFLQFLDCVHQLVKQFPSEFEFTDNYLIKILHHSCSSLFGTFIGNNVNQRTNLKLNETTISLWAYLRIEVDTFTNALYQPSQEVLRPSCRVKDIDLWSAVYVPVTGPSSGIVIPYSSSVNKKAPSSVFNHDNSNRVLAVLNIDENKNETDCNHEIKCNSQSKCDLNRSASCENLFSKTTNSLVKDTVNLSPVKSCEPESLARHQSATRLSTGKELTELNSIDLNLQIQNCDNEKLNETETKLDEYQISKLNTRFNNGSYVNGHLTNGNAETNIYEKDLNHNDSQNVLQSLNHNSKTPHVHLLNHTEKPFFGIDGEITKDKSYSHMKDLILYHTRMIATLKQKMKECDLRMHEKYETNGSPKHSNINGNHDTHQNTLSSNSKSSQLEIKPQVNDMVNSKKMGESNSSLPLTSPKSTNITEETQLNGLNTNSPGQD